MRLKEQDSAILSGREWLCNFIKYKIVADCNRHVIQAARHPVDLDQRQVDAVAARIELDLRIGYAFTRFQTTNLQKLGGALENKMLSYGDCFYSFRFETTRLIVF